MQKAQYQPLKLTTGHYWQLFWDAEFQKREIREEQEENLSCKVKESKFKWNKLGNPEIVLKFPQGQKESRKKTDARKAVVT